MPPKKKKGGDKREKEKPLLTVQGVLRLEKSFQKAKHDDAEVILVRKTLPGAKGDDEVEAEEMKLVPGESEHDQVNYKAGYDIGPANPFPQNKPEAEIFEAQKVVDAKVEAFEELKAESERRKKEVEEKWIEEGKMSVDQPELADKPYSPPDPAKLDPDNPDNYFMPPEDDSGRLPDDFGKDAKIVAPPGEEDVDHLKARTDGPSDVSKTRGAEDWVPVAPEAKQVQSMIEAASGSAEDQPDTPADSALLPQMKPLPAEEDFGAAMALDVGLKMEEKRRLERMQAIKEGRATEEDYTEEYNYEHNMVFSLDEIEERKRREEDAAKAASQMGPQMGPEGLSHIQQALEAQSDYDAQKVLAAHWDFVKTNPGDFNGWTYLLQHVESVSQVEEVRNAYNAFLPLYPYCYAYWIRYSDIEKKYGHWQRSLAILHRGLEAIPLSTDLWMAYLDLYKTMYEKHENFEVLFRGQFERAVATVGLDFRSDPLWDRYLEWETSRKNLRYVTAIYQRLVGVPTKLFNKHWDNFIAFVRDHHPRDVLEYEAYEDLRKVTCSELGLTYRPDPIKGEHKTREVVQPEDKLKAGMKERIVASVVQAHERVEEAVDKRLKYEDRIKRTYFHVKPLELKQLKNWESYLDFEISEGDHERTVTLFERCLIPCALYEQFWIKYARYMETRLKAEGMADKENNASSAMDTSENSSASPLKKARWSFGTGLNKVDEIRDRRQAWTLKGWARKDAEGNEYMVAEDAAADTKEEGKKPEGVDSQDQQIVEDAEKPAPQKSGQEGGEEDEGEEEGDIVNTYFEREIGKEMQGVCKTHWSLGGQGLQSVRDVYHRACVVHCPKRALVKMKWASFEEEHDNIEKARDILMKLNTQYPLLLECNMQLIDIERRLGNMEAAQEFYKKLTKKVPSNRKNIKTWLAMKFSRFQFKVCGQPDKALATLRSALKKERAEVKLYAQIIDICYQRQPVDVSGVTAAIELALVANELTNMQKLEFVKRKVEFMQEFGDVKRYRDAGEQLKQFRKLCAVDLKVQAKKKKELEKEELKLKELEEIKAHTRAQAGLKARIAEQEGRLLCTSCQASMVPNAQGVYEFEGFDPERALVMRKGAGGGGGEEVEDLMGGGGEGDGVEGGGGAGGGGEDDDGVIDLLDMDIAPEEEAQIKKSLEEKTKYKEVAPTWELNIETYGYGKGTANKKTYDPDYEHVESAKFKEYERLEAEGYDEEIKDPDRDKLKNIGPRPGLGNKKPGEKRPREDEDDDPKSKFLTSDYVVPPKVPQLQLGPGIGPVRPRKGAPGEDDEGKLSKDTFELPPEIADPQKAPCVNVPEWFVKEGGELCLSDTENGVSIIRYWPKFLSGKGNHMMFNRLRKYCKWHQKQVQIGGDWKHETRLVAWYGPCDYKYSGLQLQKNLNWAPELLDLLHRLIAMTRHEFNSCFANLYRHGHDMCGWHSDVHPQLGRNPSVASVSLGAVRVFEFRRKNGPPNFIRFPLFPGSLLVMEGATQEDWLHCLPRDTNCTEERINLTFRIMYAMNKR